MHKIQVEQFCVEIMQQVYSGNGRFIYKGKINFQGKEKIIALKKQDSISDYEKYVLRILKENKFQFIVEIIAFEQNADGYSYTIMEFGQEIDLNNHSLKLEVCLQMAQGVQEFHTLKFIHRDLKPENFIMSFDNKIKLIDFGIVRKNTDTQSKTQEIGTQMYMAPEVMTSSDYDSSVDIWSLGMIFYRIFSNEQFYNDKESHYFFMKRLVEQTQLQINNVIKSQENLNDWQKDLLQKMIVQRLNNNQQIDQKIKRITIDKLIDELKIQRKQMETIIFYWEEKIEDVQFYYSNHIQIGIDKFQIQYTKDYKIIYSYHGIILRKDQIQDTTVKPELLKNLEQIKYLNWIGVYDQNKKKVGRWEAIWNGQKVYVGGEYQSGRKSGQWIDLMQNYWSKAQVHEIGKYENGIRKGVWEFVYQNKTIGGGKYNDVGNKQGKWIDLSENFFDYAQVTQNGEYNMNNMKVGRWDIMYCYSDRFGVEKQKQIGGGSYDKEGSQKKIGKWVELDQNFKSDKQVIYYGEYNKNNIKVGRWDIMYDRWGGGQYKQIGGGSYDKEGNQQKIGKWVELDEEFNDDKKVTYNGEYNINKMKVDRWDIMYDRWGDGQYNQIGGGSYDKEGNQKKIGKWVELDEKFNPNSGLFRRKFYIYVGLGMWHLDW